MDRNKVLVVDDADIVCAAFKAELTQEGFEVDGALSGKMALKMAKAKEYALIFIDMVMPKMDGIQTCKSLKKVSPDSVMIFMTGHVEGELTAKELKFQEAGGKLYYLYKPFVEGEILEVTKKALAKR